MGGATGGEESLSYYIVYIHFATGARTPEVVAA